MVLGRRSCIAAAALTVVGALALGAHFQPATYSKLWTSEAIFEEDFDGNELNRSSWNSCHWWDNDGCTIGSNNELEWYLPSQVVIIDGELHLVAEKTDTQGSDGRIYPYRSGMVTTGPPTYEAEPKFAFTYGTIEARVRVPEGVGLWSALWLLPASREPRPEIDIMEVLGNDPKNLLMHLHPKVREANSFLQEYAVALGADFSDNWHRVRLEWKPGTLAFLVDGERVWELGGPHVPDEPMYLVANLAVGGVYPGSPDSTTRFPATYRIDYIRVWQATS
jgi:beta-glucanase (GH16 family)